MRTLRMAKCDRHETVSCRVLALAPFSPAPHRLPHHYNGVVHCYNDSHERMQLLHWDVATGRPLVHPQHGQHWATSTAVRLAAAPFVYRGSTAERHAVHSSQVACVWFAVDNERLLSARDTDCCVLQWQVKGPALCGAATDGVRLGRFGAATIGGRGEGGVGTASDVMATDAKGGETLANMGLSNQGVTAGIVTADYVQQKVAELQAELDTELESIRRRGRCAGLPAACMYACTHVHRASSHNALLCSLCELHARESATACCSYASAFALLNLCTASRSACTGRSWCGGSTEQLLPCT
jgi:hypothetical protein